MKFSVGYGQRGDELWKDAVKEFKNSISEIYFAVPGFANGRSCGDASDTLSDFEYRKREEKDLDEISTLGIPFNLLLNGNCYGKDSLSRKFFEKVGNTVDEFSERYNLKSVTTTSPLIAKFLKENFAGIEVRASVNMEIATTDGMDYLSDVFDSFYLARDCNRNLTEIKKARKWCDENGKKLYGLANSGCLNFCSSHIFHDNLVAHEKEISAMDNAYVFTGQCWNYLKKPEKQKAWLRITNFIRPEDVPLYEGLFDGMKLATRVNSNPYRVIKAYASGKYYGGLNDLLEPNHAGLFYPVIIENSKIPSDFGLHTLNCNKKCNECGYCKEAFENALLHLE